MKYRVIAAALLCGSLLCGCENAADSRAIEANIERARVQIAAQTDEKSRLETELQKVGKLVAERQKLQIEFRRLSLDRSTLLKQLKQGSRP